MKIKYELNRIVMVSAGWNEEVYTEMVSNGQHTAFLYKGAIYAITYNLWSPILKTPGFIKMLGSMESPLSLHDAFQYGWEVATNNYVLWDNHIIKDGRSYPALWESSISSEAIYL